MQSHCPVVSWHGHCHRTDELHGRPNNDHDTYCWAFAFDESALYQSETRSKLPTQTSMTRVTDVKCPERHMVRVFENRMELVVVLTMILI